jgi:multidrug efflux pump subunit AcrA (membrane-fusion protein)
MKQFLPILGLLALLAGCGSEPGAGHDDHDHSGETGGHAGPLFQPGRGLRLGETAAQQLRIETLEVAVSTLTAGHSHTATVFRLAGEFSAFRYQTGNAYAVATLPAEQAAGLAPGRAMTLHTGGGGSLPATLQRIDEQTRELNGQVDLILEIPGAPEGLAIGQALRASWEEPPDDTDKTLVLPSPAVLETARGDFVYVDNAGAYLRSPVKLGLRRNGEVQILEGLFEGDVVVVNGTRDLYLVELQAVNAGTGCTHAH